MAMSSDPQAGDASALAWAEEAHALVQVRPRRAIALAERALTRAASTGDVRAEIAARHALGWAQKVIGDEGAGRATLRAGIKLAERHGDRRGVGILRRSLAVSHVHAGETRAAEREITAALALLSGRDRARSQVHRLEIYRKTPAVDPTAYRRVCADAASALRLLRGEDDRIWQARILFNRGSLRSDRGDFERAESDLRRAQALYAELGAQAAVVNASVVLAELAERRGDVLSALESLEHARADAERDHIYNLENLEELSVNVYAQARLLPEARAAAGAYVELCARTGRGDLANALLISARIALMSGDSVSARRDSIRAVRSFAARGKSVQAALATVMSLRAQLPDGDPPSSAVRSGVHAAAVLATAGWRRDSLRARLAVARVALARGSRAVAHDQLELALPLRSLGTVSDRIELCYAQALLELAEGTGGAAEPLLEHGLQLLDGYRAALGAIELRATASGMGTDLAQQGLRLALDSKEPAKILAWSERLRASALRQPAVRPPSDAKLRSLQAELRRSAADRAAGRQRQLEAAIRARSRIVEPRGGAEAALPDSGTAARALGHRVFVEYVELDGSLHALTLRDERLVLHELGAERAKDELEWLRFALGQLARADVRGQRRKAARDGTHAAAHALDRLLVQPMLPAVGKAELVLVPTGALHALPWAVLPSLRARPFSVAPSLAIWASRAAHPPSRRRKVMLAAGPRLRHAEAEVRGLAEVLPGTTPLTGADATAEGVLAALDGSALAHLACHGHFRSDSPLFSSLELADGPLNVYELQSLRRAPEIVVLSACDLGLSALHPGDELLGLATVLLGMGTRTVVASVAPVSDAASKRLMLAFHKNLLGGDPPATALARAQARTQAASFVCLGVG
jgi:hypothetical protein